MAIRRIWLDWNHACIPQAAAWLLEREIRARRSSAKAAGHVICDLRDVACILPGQRAGRVLRGELIRQCRERGLQLVPPRVYTPGSLLAESTSDQPVATDVEMTLAWAHALRNAEPNSIRALAPRLPAPDEVLAWHGLAKIITDLHDDLAGALVSFDQVADRAERLEMFGEAERWRCLEQLETGYHAALKHAGLIDANRARQAALSRSQIHSQTLALIGVPELNAMQRLLITAFSGEVVALVHAPEALADRFDEFGCVAPDAWADARINLRDDQIISADRPDDQVQHALRTIAAFEGRFGAAQITIGLGDESIRDNFEHAADWAGLSVHWAGGTPLSATPPCRALRLISNYLDDARFAEFATLLRHPDVERWLSDHINDVELGIGDWLSLLDRYFADHLQERFSGEWLGDERTARRLGAVYRAIQDLLNPLVETPNNSKPLTQPLGAWAQPILGVLARLYQRLEKSNPRAHRTDRLRLETLERIRDVLSEFAAAPPSLHPAVSATQAIAMALDRLERQALPEPSEDDQIEMVGWLELHLDAAPALIIAGFNEGHVPKSATADAFLPDSLRQMLGMPCNHTRFARDAYLMEAIRHSRSQLTVISGRRTARGEPLTPSRLLLACDDETLVRRVKSLCDDHSDRQRPAPIGLTALASAQSRFIVPPLPAGLRARESMTITEFRSYLTCPYRYALERLLRLECMDDAVTELDPLKFGTLAHEVLCEFGCDTDINASANAERIGRFLIDALHRRSAERFGRSPPTSVRVQLARMEQRLRSFATLQASMVTDGWRIQHCEVSFKEAIALDVPDDAGGPMPLRGKIDRIDRNERAGTWRIIDYKTGDSPKSPQAAHIGRERCEIIEPGDWKDLQLPLYHYLATRSDLNITGDIRLAYICLPKQADGAEVKDAPWTDEQIAQAVDVARDVVMRIRAGQFERNREYRSDFDPFARICQTSAFREDELELEVES